MGYTYSSVALAAVPIFTRCHLPVLANAVSSPKLSGSSPYFFRNELTDAFGGTALGKYVVNTLHLKKIAVLNQVDDFGNGVTDAFVAAAKGAGGTIVSRDGYQLGTKDFSVQVQKIKDEGADAIFVGGFAPESAKIAIQARAIGVTAQLLNTAASLDKQLITLGGKSVEGTILWGTFLPTLFSDPRVKGFVTRFKAKYHSIPSEWSAKGYDGVYAVKAAAEKQKSTSREAIRTGFTKLKNLPGVTGTTTFDSKGDRRASIHFIQVKGGTFLLAPHSK